MVPCEQLRVLQYGIAPLPPLGGSGGAHGAAERSAPDVRSAGEEQQILVRVLIHTQLALAPGLDETEQRSPAPTARPFGHKRSHVRASRGLSVPATGRHEAVPPSKHARTRKHISAVRTATYLLVATSAHASHRSGPVQPMLGSANSRSGSCKQVSSHSGRSRRGCWSCACYS